MLAEDIHHRLQSLRGGWSYPEDTVDRFVAGDPATEVRGVAVMWMSYAWALEKAVALGCNLVITHEPTFFEHFDRAPETNRLAAAIRKREFIKENGLVVLRCHDLWDRIREHGIPDSWGRFLELGPAAEATEYLRVYEVEPTTAVAFARKVAARTVALGQPEVQLIGPPDRPVRRVSTGTGAITPFLASVEQLAVDLAVCSDDGIDYWRDGALAIDAGVPIVVVNHPVSEEAGVASLADTVSRMLPSLPVHHIPQRCMYRLVSG